MRDTRVPCTSPQEAWPSSKCQRILRPLKLKITALERTLSTSQSVADGISSWTDHLSRSRCRREPSSDSSAAYNPSSSNLRKYGAAKRRAMSNKDKTTSKQVFPGTDQLFSELRSSVAPSVSAAYLGVYYAFKTILERVEVPDRFPSLASYAAIALGRCIHLTSAEYTDCPISADDWYDAAPAHYRSKVTIGHAAQMIIASYEILAPIMPALTLLGAPCSSELLSTILDKTSLLEARKLDVQALQSLANQIGKPWAIKLYYTQNFSLDYLRCASFAVLLESKLEAELDDYTLALYVKASTSAIQYLGRCRHKSENGLRIIDAVEEMSLRLLRHPSKTAINYFAELYSDLRHEYFLGLQLGFCISSLNFSRSDRTLISKIAEISARLSRASTADRDQVLSYLVNAWSTDMIVELVETLVGRVDDLAISLAQECSRQFDGDFVIWASTLEADIVAAKCSQESEKYRFEPLLDSWVARTPGLKKLSSNKMIDMTDTEDDADGADDEEDTISDDDEYHADRSRTCLSFAEIDCSLEDDLLCEVKSPKSILSERVLDILSAKRSTDKQESAKLMRKFGRVCYKDGEPLSPLVLRSKQAKKVIPANLHLSPLQKTRSKRNMERSEGSEGSEASQLPRVLTRAKRRKLSPQDILGDIRCPPADLTISTNRVMRKPLRELNNLKSSFAALRKLKKRPIAATPDRTDDDLTSDLEESLVLPEHPRSESDELSML